MNKTGTNAADVLEGAYSNDLLTGLGDNDFLSGLSGDDTLDGGAGNDSLYGGAGNDDLYDSFGSNYLDGGTGDDILYLYDNAGNGTLVGGIGADSLYGADGRDLLQGNDGDDYLQASAGNDTLDGGTGNDYLGGGTGNDYYIIRDLHATLYDTGGTDSGLIYVDFYKPSTSVENWSWASGVQQLPYWIDALLPAEAPGFLPLLEAGKTFHYSFPTSAPSHFSAEDRSGFSAFNTQQKAFAKQALSYISSVIDVQFVETIDSTGLNTIVFANNTQPTSTGYAYYPYPSAIGSDLLLDNTTSGNLSPADGQYAALTLIHELGHALGLKHTFSHGDASGDAGEGPYLPSAEESTRWSVMSYTDRVDDYHLRYSPFDIAALQYLYGPSKANQSDSTYTLSNTATNFIWDGGGTDTIDGSGITQAITLYLDHGVWGYIGSKSSLISTAGQITINIGTMIEHANGGSGNDTIVGNDNDNRISSNGGSDTITGGAGNDSLDGGRGTDVVLFSGTRSDFSITKTSTGHIAIDRSGTEGTDILTNIEMATFSATTLVLATDPSVGQTYSGIEGIDSLSGGVGDDILNGNAGNDVLTPGAGNDIIDGGDGTDSLFLQGERNAFTMTQTSIGFTLNHTTGSEGFDTVSNVERFIFRDTALAYDTDGVAGQAYRLYQAAFNRKPDIQGLGFWISHMEKGMSLLEVSSRFQESAEFTSLYGSSVSNTQLVTLLYQNVLHRTPDATETSFWVNILDTGQQSRAVVLTSFSESPENQAQVIGSIQNGMEYTYFA